jgi:hypothetical protein
MCGQASIPALHQFDGLLIHARRVWRASGEYDERGFVEQAQADRGLDGCEIKGAGGGKG